VDQRPPFDSVTGVPVIDLDHYCCGAHGFAALIETQVDGKSHKVLFDTGPDSISLVRNVAAMEVPLLAIERVIISHWHSDHSGGLLSFLKLRRATHPEISSPVVDVHPDQPIARGIAPGPKYDKVIARLAADPTFELIKEAGGIVEMNRDSHTVADNTIFVSGEIPRVTDFEGGILGGMRWIEENGRGKWTKEEHIYDERYAAIDVVGKGLVIFSACSHAGIVNVVQDAVKTFSRPIYMIIGGLHLATPDLIPRIPPTVDFLSHQLRPAPTYILPMHCSGFTAKVALENALGDGCVPAGVGIKIEIKGDEATEKALLPPTF